MKSSPVLRHFQKVSLSGSRSRSKGALSCDLHRRTVSTSSVSFEKHSTCPFAAVTNPLSRLVPSADFRSHTECPRAKHSDLLSLTRSSSSVAEVFELDNLETTSEENVKPFSSIPGPGGLHKIPYLGTGLLFKPFGKYPVEQIDKVWTELHDTYGPIVRVRVGGNWQVIVEDLEDVKQVLLPKDPFPHRPAIQPDQVYFKRENPEVLTLGSANGEEWRRLRSPLNARMNRPVSTVHYLSSQEAVATDLCDWLDRLQHEDPSHMQQLFFRYAAESIGVVAFNKRIGFLDADADPEVKEYTEKLLECYRTVIYSIFEATFGKQWVFHFIRDAYYKKYKEARDYTLQLSTQFVEEAMREAERKRREGTLDAEEPNFLMSLLSEKDLKFIDVLIICDALMTAGSDSTACALQLLFYTLAKNPDKQEKLAQEIHGELGPDGNITQEGLNRMTYLKAAVREAMRLHFPIPTGASRKLPYDLVLQGYNIPKGVSIQASSNRIAKSPRYFDQPDKYLPERWLRSDNGRREKTIPFLAFLPFGFGPRSCIGRRFAEQELYLAAMKVVQKYKVGLKDDYDALETAFTPFCGPTRPLPLTFTPRL